VSLEPLRGVDEQASTELRCRILQVAATSHLHFRGELHGVLPDPSVDLFRVMADLLVPRETLARCCSYLTGLPPSYQSL